MVILRFRGGELILSSDLVFVKDKASNRREKKPTLDYDIIKTNVNSEVVKEDDEGYDKDVEED